MFLLCFALYFISIGYYVKLRLYEFVEIHIICIINYNFLFKRLLNYYVITNLNIKLSADL